jgi:hypothetical protein
MKGQANAYSHTHCQAAPANAVNQLSEVSMKKHDCSSMVSDLEALYLLLK